METTSDRVVAISFSLGLHVLVALALCFALFWHPAWHPDEDGGPAIEATLVGAPQRSAASSRPRVTTPQPQREAVPTPPQPAPVPAPVPQPQPKQLQSQSQVPKPDTVDQDEVKRLALQAAEQQKEQDERHRQAQVDLDRKQEQLQAENRAQAKAQADALAKQLAAIRKERADAERQVKLQEEKLKQIEDRKQTLARNDAPATQPGAAAKASKGSDATGQYLQAIRDVVNQNWHHDGVPERTHCEVHFKQLRGGDVFDVSFGNCPFDAGARASVEDALKKTPLPYAGFENVFVREGTIDLCYPEEACK